MLTKDFFVLSWGDMCSKTWGVNRILSCKVRLSGVSLDSMCVSLKTHTLRKVRGPNLQQPVEVEMVRVIKVIQAHLGPLEWGIVASWKEKLHTPPHGGFSKKWLSALRRDCTRTQPCEQPRCLSIYLYMPVLMRPRRSCSWLCRSSCPPVSTFQCWGYRHAPPSLVFSLW